MRQARGNRGKEKNSKGEKTSQEKLILSGKKLKLFIDASVFIAASASKEGGSASLLKIYQKVSFTPVTTQAVLNESELNIKAHKSSLIERQHYSIINSSGRIKNGKC